MNAGRIALRGAMAVTVAATASLAGGTAQAAPGSQPGRSQAAGPKFCGTSGGDDVGVTLEANSVLRSTPWPEGDPVGCYGPQGSTGHTIDVSVFAAKVQMYCWTYGNWEDDDASAGGGTSVWYRVDGASGSWGGAWTSGVNVFGGHSAPPTLRRCLP
ncbi:hypothetical protein [Actinomadura rupiterrae]|uniref:hypothetical protein n=1 Tax=Actinomadura rupiterrae TaxID=559627 RepID=UPI0020A53591|nr:hypothetical protein [Actinomadura rupiterrae]MCP2341449.1 hypothetical protein [Actinomadura rupiterrae]